MSGGAVLTSLVCISYQTGYPSISKQVKLAKKSNMVHHAPVHLGTIKMGKKNYTPFYGVARDCVICY